MYASPADVLNLTGSTVTPAQIGQAQAIVELYCNRFEEAAEHFSAKDERILKLATAYQCAFMAQNNVFTTGDLESLAQGDLAVTWKNSAASSDSKVIAPLAKKALAQLSWNRTRSILTSTAFTSMDDEDDLEDDDVIARWTAL